MGTYRDDLQAATARAEAAEKHVEELEEEKKQIRFPKPTKEPGAFHRWWKENAVVAVVLGIIFSIFSYFTVVIILDAVHRDDIRFCRTQRKSCEYSGRILCSDEWVIVAHRPWPSGAFVIEKAGSFKSKAEALKRATEIGCPKVEE